MAGVNVDFLDFNYKNYRKAMLLMVTEDQDRFVNNVAEMYMIACFEKYRIKIIIDTESKQMVGVCMYNKDTETNFSLRGFMIDFRYQKKGYGTAAMNKLIQNAKEDPLVATMTLSVIYDNFKGMKFFTSFGFKRTSISDSHYTYRLTF